MIINTRTAAQGQITILELHGALTLGEAPQLREASQRAESSLTREPKVVSSAQNLHRRTFERAQWEISVEFDASQDESGVVEITQSFQRGTR